MMTLTDRRVTGGVDTHGDVHVAAALDSATGRQLATESFPTTRSGYEDLLEWFGGFGELDEIGVESTGSYGAGLTRFLQTEGVTVIEVDRPDPVDAAAAARAVLSGRAASIPKSRDGAVEAIRAIEVVYHGAVKDRTRAINQFKSLLVSAPQSLRDKFRGLRFTAQLTRAKRAGETTGDLVEIETRRALKELARTIAFLDDQTGRLETRIGELTSEASPALLGLQGVGPHVAAQLLAAAGDNPHRMGSEAAFAKLCGACPISASSGKTTRHRLNRGGDRRANNALFVIVLVRMRYDPTTRAYVARRTSEGKSRKEIMRCLKRFVAREVYQALINPPTDLPTGPLLRQLRNNHGLSLTVVCNAIGTTPIGLSRLERGLTHDTRLARTAHQFLTETTG